jgi:hypothetical protein
VREYRIDLTRAGDFAGVVDAFNAGFCRYWGGAWQGRSWDAFEDHLYSGLDAEGHWRYRLVFECWDGCAGLDPRDRRIIQRTLAGIPQIEVVFA